jgi:tetratricopeptide (TPR) repeat protein
MKRSAYFPVLAVATLSLLTMVTGCSKLQARDQLIKGVQAYKNAKFEEAIDHFQNAERLDPQLANAPLYLATAYAQQVVPDANTPENTKNAQLAVDAYKQVLAKDPNDLTALKGIGAVYLNTGKTEEAKAWQRKVTAADPNDPVAHYTIGVVDWRVAYKNAIATRNGLGLQDNGDMIKDKAACQKLAEVNAPLVDEGIKELLKAIELRPGYDDAMSYLSLLYRRKADLDCGDEAAHKADLASFDEWRDKTMATRKANEAKKNQQTPGGITLDTPSSGK